MRLEESLNEAAVPLADPDAAADFSAAPAALIGVGAGGQRLVARVRARFARETPPNAEGLRLLSPGSDPDALSQAVREAARFLMRQRSVSALEQGFSIRRPARRYLALHLVFAAELAETNAAALLECLQAAFDLHHPAAGMEILFLLDATGTDLDGGIVPDAAPVLRQMEDAARRLRASQTRRWSAAARVRILLAHPHRADGSRLDHPCLLLPRAAPSPDTSEDDLPEDEFEETLAAVLAGHLSAGPFFDGLAAGQDAPPFALWGWARAVLPREPILDAVAGRLTADALERTTALEPGDGTLTLQAASLVEHDASETWKEWVRTRDAVLLDRRALLRRLLRTERPGALAVEDAPPPPPPRRSLSARLFGWFWGTSPPPAEVGLRPLSVRLGLPALRWQSGDPKAWPDALRRLDAEGAVACDALIDELRTQDRVSDASAEVCLALARCIDVCVRGHLGGAEAGRRAALEAVAQALLQIKAAGSTPFAPPVPPDGVGLAGAAGLPGAWELYCKRCAQQPAWPAALSVGLAYGTLGITACAAFALPVLLFGWPFTVICLMFAAGRQALAMGRLMRLGDYLQECLRAKYGQRLLDWGEQAAGTPSHDGVYQAVIHYLEECELPALANFDAERDAAAARLRRPPPFALPSGTDEFLADARTSDDLHRMVREAGGEDAVADDARTLLRQQNIFADWRVPALEQKLALAKPFLRRTRLAGWERGALPLGGFLRGVLAPRLPTMGADAAFAAWVRRRMDGLALRSVPLALLPPSHPERDNESVSAEAADGHRNLRANDVLVSVTVVAPASLEWHTAGEPAPNPGILPTESGVQDLIAWFGVPSPANRVLTEEADEVACLVLLSGLSAEEALSALSPAKAEMEARDTSAPVRLDVVSVNGSNGHVRRPALDPAHESSREGDAL